MTWFAVANMEDIPLYSGACALVNDQEIAIFRIQKEKFFAIANYDPFSQAPVLSRGIVGDLQGEVVVASPIYKQHFSLTTGKCLENKEISVKTWPVKIENNQVCILMD